MMTFYTSEKKIKKKSNTSRWIVVIALLLFNGLVIIPGLYLFLFSIAVSNAYYVDNLSDFTVKSPDGEYELYFVDSMEFTAPYLSVFCKKRDWIDLKKLGYVYYFGVLEYDTMYCTWDYEDKFVTLHFQQKRRNNSIDEVEESFKIGDAPAFFETRSFITWYYTHSGALAWTLIVMCFVFNLSGIVLTAVLIIRGLRRKMAKNHMKK